MPTLQGKWCFKYNKEPIMSSDTYLSQTIEFIISGDPQPFYSITVENGYINIQDRGHGGNSLYVPGDGWVSPLPDYLNFGETPQEVSEDFYNWFTKNAVNLQPTGTWRFNKTLTEHIARREVSTTADSHNRAGLLCTLFNGEVSVYELEYGYSGNYICGYENYDNDNGEYYIWTSEDGWFNEEARIVTFYDNIVQLDPEFALWFYENAHSMELKLYSECYIAETADKIRECANDNTLTFKVSDLADGVQTVYDAGYSQGMAESDISLQYKTVSPSAVTQTVTPDSGYNGLSAVTVRPCTGTKSITSTGLFNVVDYQYAQVSDSDLIAGNIKSGVDILGVTGTYEGEGGLTVNDMSIGTVGAMPSGDLSLTVTDPNGNFSWKTYTPTNGKVLPENIVAGKTVLGVAGAGAGSGSSVTAGISLAHATGSGKDEQVEIHYMTPEGTQAMKLVLVPASAYATPVSTTFTTVMNAPISVQVPDDTRQLYCYLSDSEYMPLIGTDCGGTITYCVAKAGTANWPMLYVQEVQEVQDTVNYPVLIQGLYLDRMLTVNDRNFWHPDTYLEGVGSMAFDLSDFVEGSLTSSSSTAEVTILNKSTRWSVDVQVIARYSVRNQSTGDVVEDTFNYVISNLSPETDSSTACDSTYNGNPYSDGRWSWEIAGVCFHE